MIAIPGIDAILEQFRQPDYRARLQEEMTIAESIQLRTTEVVVSACFVVLGATIGSYLNVVVYRVPRGISLVHQRSACPECATPIDGRDNIPILGWLLLKGACRNCRLPIAARYPLVEGVAGGIFMLLYFLELISGGANLPVRPPNSHAGVVWVFFYIKWDLVGLYLFHCLLLLSLLTWALIRYDGHQVPWRSIATTFFLFLIPLAIWPQLQLVSAWPISVDSASPSMANVLTGAAMSAAFGGCLGWLIDLFLWRCDRRSISRPSAPPVDPLACSHTSQESRRHARLWNRLAQKGIGGIDPGLSGIAD